MFFSRRGFDNAYLHQTTPVPIWQVKRIGRVIGLLLNQRLFIRKIAAITAQPPARVTSNVTMSIFIRRRCRSRGKAGNKSLLICRIMRGHGLTGAEILQQRNCYNQIAACNNPFTIGC
jgi:hypothetical protein